MSCCQGNSQQQFQNRIENYHYRRDTRNPANFQMESNTYVLNPQAYYSPPMPSYTTQYDADLRTKFNTSDIPDFLNFKNDPRSTGADVFEDRPSLWRGQYYSFSY